MEFEEFSEFCQILPVRHSKFSLPLPPTLFKRHCKRVFKINFRLKKTDVIPSTSLKILDGSARLFTPLLWQLSSGQKWKLWK